jgi:hypothetical protein
MSPDSSLRASGSETVDIGKQYSLDDAFKAAARRHQSRYRATVLKVDCDEYGNRLTEPDAKALLNYFDGFNVRGTLKSRYPHYSKGRDGDMLRSEHIPFNLFAPLLSSGSLAQRLIRGAFGIGCAGPFQIQLEFAPEPKETHLNDATSFDAFIRFKNPQGKKAGIGIEVKYTEKEYRIGKTEKANVENPRSKYWQVTRESEAFADPTNPELGTDALRQVWRNHLLGLSMRRLGELDDFYSIILYPTGNRHFKEVLDRYRALLTESGREKVFGCAYETYIQAIDGDEETLRWKRYLSDRYIVPD